MKFTIVMTWVVIVALTIVVALTANMVDKLSQYQLEVEGWTVRFTNACDARFKVLEKRAQQQEEIIRVLNAAVLSQHDSDFEDLLQSYMGRLEDDRRKKQRQSLQPRIH